MFASISCFRSIRHRLELPACTIVKYQKSEPIFIKDFILAQYLANLSLYFIFVNVAVLNSQILLN